MEGVWIHRQDWKVVKAKAEVTADLLKYAGVILLEHAKGKSAPMNLRMARKEERKLLVGQRD